MSNANLTADANPTEPIYTFGEVPFPADIDNLTTTYTPFNSVIRSQDTIYRLEIKDILRLKATTNPTYPDNDIRMVSVDIPTLVGIPESQSMTKNVDPRVFGTSNWCRALLNTTDYFAFELKCDIDSSQPRIL